MANVPVYSAEETSLLGGNPLLNGLANAVLGKNTDTSGTTVQNTNNTSAQNTGTVGSTTTNQTVGTTGTQNTGMTGNTSQTQVGSTTGSQNTSLTGATTQNQTGASTQTTSGTVGTTGGTTQNSTQQNTTSGTQSTTGAQKTTGTVGTTGINSTTGTQTTSQSADVSGLQSILARQLGGVTPEMLKAIFQEGSKAAPDLVTAQAGALGARGVGNSPMARVLNDLNSRLTNQAAMLSNDLLNQASSTAGRIADLTKSTTTATDQTQKTTQEQVQDLLTSTNSQQLNQQVADVINSTVGSMTQNQTTSQTQNQTSSQQQTGTSSQLTDQQTAGTSMQTQNTAQTQNTLQTSAQDQIIAGTTGSVQNQTQTGTQTQNATLTKEEQVKQQQVLNSNLLGKSAGLLAGGLGLAAAYSAAQKAGFFGKLPDFVKGLLNNGTSLQVIDRALRADNLPSIMNPEGGLDLSGLPNMNIDELINSIPDLASNIDFGGGDSGNFFDGVSDFFGEFADGGKLEFLPTPNLETPKKPVVEQDTSIQQMMAALGMGSFGGNSGGSSSAGGGAAAETPTMAPGEADRKSVV